MLCLDHFGVAALGLEVAAEALGLDAAEALGLVLDLVFVVSIISIVFHIDVGGGRLLAFCT